MLSSFGDFMTTSASTTAFAQRVRTNLRATNLLALSEGISFDEATELLQNPPGWSGHAERVRTNLRTANIMALSEDISLEQAVKRMSVVEDYVITFFLCFICGYLAFDLILHSSAIPLAQQLFTLGAFVVCCSLMVDHFIKVKKKLRK
jgi:hypothetical protein